MGLILHRQQEKEWVLPLAEVGVPVQNCLQPQWALQMDKNQEYP
jgi:hypothetical protein